MPKLSETLRYTFKAASDSGEKLCMLVGTLYAEAFMQTIGMPTWCKVLGAVPAAAIITTSLCTGYRHADTVAPNRPTNPNVNGYDLG